MNIWLLIACILLGLLSVSLLYYLCMVKCALRKIQKELDEKIKEDTNKLIEVPFRDRDVSNLAARLNVELKDLKREQRKLQQGDIKLKEAITNISHDIRTPLTAICGYLDLLQLEEKSAKAERYLSIIEERTEALKTLTEELFRYSVTVSVSKELPLEEVNLGGAVEESIAAFYGALSGHGILPKIQLPERPILCKLNPKAIARILNNILNNAVKYSDGDLCITLLDTGELFIGNQAKQLDKVTVEKLFDRFFTVESGEKATGLGLSIAKLLTEQMHGEISASYKKDRLVVRLYFPVDNLVHQSVIGESEAI